jgi:hypothetical protein
MTLPGLAIQIYWFNALVALVCFVSVGVLMRTVNSRAVARLALLGPLVAAGTLILVAFLLWGTPHFLILVVPVLAISSLFGLRALARST